MAILQTMTGKLDNAAIAKYMGNGQSSVIPFDTYLPFFDYLLPYLSCPILSHPHQPTNQPNPGCTVSAIQHRIQRIKEKAHSGDSGSGVGSPAGDQTPGTPSPEKKKRGRPAGSKKVTGYKSPAKKAKADGENEVGGAGAGGAGQGDGGGYAEDADA